MPRRVKVLSEAYDVVRTVAICLVAMGIVAYAMVVTDRPRFGLILGGVVVGAMTIFQVWRAVKQLHRQSEMAHHAAARAERHYVDVLRKIVRFVEAREQYGNGHSERVGRLARQMAAGMSLPHEHCQLIGLAGELHDIGLLAIPDGILKKRCRLGAQDFATIREHSEVSYEILKPLEMLKGVLPAIRHHHERMNGTGYPAGLAGERVPLEAQILAVADTYDAMTHDRPHQRALSPLDAINELRRCTPHGYHCGCVETLARVLHLPKPAEVPAGSGPTKSRHFF